MRSPKVPLGQPLAATIFACLVARAATAGAQTKPASVEVSWVRAEGAEAYLARAPGSPAERLCTLETLGMLLNHLDDARTTERRELPLPAAWGAERVGEVAERARAWLDAQGAPLEG